MRGTPTFCLARHQDFRKAGRGQPRAGQSALRAVAGEREAAGGPASAIEQLVSHHLHFKAAKAFSNSDTALSSRAVTDWTILIRLLRPSFVPMAASEVLPLIISAMTAS